MILLPPRACNNAAWFLGDQPTGRDRRGLRIIVVPASLRRLCVWSQRTILQKRRTDKKLCGCWRQVRSKKYTAVTPCSVPYLTVLDMTNPRLQPIGIGQSQQKVAPWPSIADSRDSFGVISPILQRGKTSPFDPTHLFARLASMARFAQAPVALPEEGDSHSRPFV